MADYKTIVVLEQDLTVDYIGGALDGIRDFYKGKNVTGRKVLLPIDFSPFIYYHNKATLDTVSSRSPCVAYEHFGLAQWKSTNRVRSGTKQH